MISGAELFVKALKAEHVDTIFAYPGGQAIDLFDALYGEKSIHVILPRHEQGLVHAADGYARSTKKTGVCLVTSGPGATNLVTGIATANYDSVPLVCFTGQVPVGLIGNDAFQEVDIVGITQGASVNTRSLSGGGKNWEVLSKKLSTSLIQVNQVWWSWIFPRISNRKTAAASIRSRSNSGAVNRTFPSIWAR